MRGRKGLWRILHRGSPGFTLVEVVTALALLTVLSATGLSAVQIAMRGLAKCLEEARWNTTVLLFDRTVRQAIEALPTAFWAPPPQLRKVGADVLIMDVAGGEEEMIRFSLRERLLSVATRTTTVLFHEITELSVETERASDGREGGIRIELVAGSHRQEFLIAWRGQRL